MALPEWPSTLPKTPLLEGYASNPSDSTIRFQPDAGKPKVRNRAFGMPDNRSEQYIFDDAERAIFMNFWRNTLSQGTLSFLKTDPEDNTIQEFQIKAPPRSTKDGIYWRVTIELDRMR